ncbi:MAG: purine-binding chemotaxis protein CheW [Pyrinomonadaceae bacterium]|jgi:purine-binding chemotaxis protein CheW|nr:purine-binding chemotaxis protein CheW [Pyrinomonadaceae bacterium]
MNNSNSSEQLTDEPGPEPVFRTLQLLQAGSQQFAIFNDEIAAIVDWREPTPLPHAPLAVLGVVTIQGRMLTVLDLARLAQTQIALATPQQHLVALRGDEQLALAVTAVGKTIAVSLGEIIRQSAADSGFTLGVLEREGVRISVVNSAELFSTALQGRERRQRSF